MTTEAFTGRVNTSRKRGIRFAAGASLLMLLLFEAALADPPRPQGDSVVRARVPDPGFPEGVAAAGKKMYVSSPAQLGHSGDARIFAFDTDDGTLHKKEYRIPAANNTPTHGLVGVALDGSGNLYVADTQWGVVRLDLSSGQTKTYAKIPDLLPCLAELKLSDECSPTVTDRPPFPNDVVFDRDGNLYVSDSFQATVWRVPPPGHKDSLPLVAKPWFQDTALERPIFGPNGIRLSPDRKQLYIAVTGPLPSLPPTEVSPPGAIYRVDFPDPEGSLTVVRKYGDEGPDNMAFGESGKLYVALAFANQIEAIPSPGSSEIIERYSGPARATNEDVAWDAPASVAFDKDSESLLVTNHALNNGILNKRLFVVFDVFVNDKAHPLERPNLLPVN